MKHKVTLELTDAQASTLLADLSKSLEEKSPDDAPVSAEISVTTFKSITGRDFPVKNWEKEVDVTAGGLSFLLAANSVGNIAKGGFGLLNSTLAKYHRGVQLSLSREKGTFSKGSALDASTMYMGGDTGVHWVNTDFSEPVWVNIRFVQPPAGQHVVILRAVFYQKACNLIA